MWERMRNWEGKSVLGGEVSIGRHQSPSPISPKSFMEKSNAHRGSERIFVTSLHSDSCLRPGDYWGYKATRLATIKPVR